mmetsp:Transcript_30293/g.88595  ORF Transcript_30293/g.88595 Transcript_30293/m.88595 type:complete len:235 (-) Transcript_30293:388-1092(-)
MYNLCILLCSRVAASMAASSLLLSLGSTLAGSFASRMGLAPPMLFPGEHGLFRKLKCCNLGNSCTTMSKKAGRSLLPSLPSPTRLPSYRKSVTDSAVLRGTPNFNACTGSDRLDRSRTSNDCLCDPANSDMAFHRSLGLINLASFALGFGVGGASIRGEWTTLPLPPRFGVEYTWRRLLSELAPGMPPSRFDLGVEGATIEAAGFADAVVVVRISCGGGISRFAFCVGYCWCCL